MGILLNKNLLPDEGQLSEKLISSFPVWKELLANLQKEFGPLTEEWKFYGAKSGWLLKVLLKKRNLLFLSPNENHFIAAFVFGDKAAGVIDTSNLPAAIKDEIKNAKKYAEGSGLRVTIRSKEEIALIINLVNIKINN